MRTTAFVGALAAACAIAGVGGYEVSTHYKSVPPPIQAVTPVGVPIDWNQYVNIITGKQPDNACPPAKDLTDLMLPCDVGGK